MANEKTAEKVHILIGGGGGIGRETAGRLVTRGERVVLASRSDECDEAANEFGDMAESRRVEATDFDAVDSLVKDVLERYGRLDGLANLAGSILIKPPHMVSRAEWDEHLALNATTAFAAVRAAVRPMARSGGGSIVLMSSCAAVTGLMNHEVIAAAKAAVIGLVKSAAASAASQGVRVNGLAPGLVDTPLGEQLTKSETSRKASEALHPLGRLGRPADIAPAIAWLLGDEAPWVTGQVIGIDGGLAAIKGAPKMSV